MGSTILKFRTEDSFIEFEVDDKGLFVETGRVNEDYPSGSQIQLDFDQTRELITYLNRMLEK